MLRNIAKSFSPLRRVQQRYRQTNACNKPKFCNVNKSYPLVDYEVATMPEMKLLILHNDVNVY